ncbi:MAG: HTH-type transcriptional regulator DegA [Firmicutes bacterium ADurb.Bin248]|nr:MAG: HTH-type transcriptional regulator DegA [Firmicutes bacterium ADurb.Bin248]HPK15967.1 LacI family DNA-binding transcriptional regulator [Clostridia bacterium]
MKNVTIKDIAKVAGVSYATVSRALSGSSEIGAETRERVLRICREMGYTTNYVARSMVMRRTKLIGLIVANIDNPFMSELAYHIEIRAREQGYNLMLCNSSHDLELERQVFTLLVGRQVDGIILVPANSDSYENLKPYISKVPTVFMSENLRDLPESYISVDNYRGTRMGTEYLHALGHRDILYFGRRKNSVTHQLRAEGYIDACRELNMEPGFCNSGFSFSSIQTGYQLARHLFQKPLRQSAIFAATDSLALGVMEAAEEAGIRIPEDLSLIGFDNIMYSGLPRINLTTVEQPKKTMASMAVDVLLEKIGDASSGYSHRILMPSLVERGTCRRVGAQAKSNE